MYIHSVLHHPLQCNQTIHNTPAKFGVLNVPCRSWTFLQWKNPWGPWSKCSSGKECDHCSFPVIECTPTGHESGQTTGMLGVIFNILLGAVRAYLISGQSSENVRATSLWSQFERRLLYLHPSRGAREKTDSSLCSHSYVFTQCVHTSIAASLPWEPAGCGWSRQSQPKCCGHCCWHLCRARCQPNRPMKICHAAWWRGRCVVGQSGGWRESGMSWRWQRSGLMFWRDSRTSCDVEMFYVFWAEEWHKSQKKKKNHVWFMNVLLHGMSS